MLLFKVVPIPLQKCSVCRGTGYAPKEVRETPEHIYCGPCFGTGEIPVQEKERKDG